MATEWVSIPEAAMRLGVSPDTIRRRMKRGELIEQRNAWQEQARRSSEAEVQLRELVAHAQMLAQALPATTGADLPGETRKTHEEPGQDADVVPPRISIWARLFGRSAD